MSKKITTTYMKRRLRIIAVLSFSVAPISYFVSGYVNSHISTNDDSDTFFRTIYLGSASISLFAVGLTVYYVFQRMGWKERILFIIMAGISFMMALENLFAGLMVGALTNF